jgi:hypothetical protein
VSNNGVISFDAPVTAHTPNSFPIPGGNFVLLSPYWADVDTRPPNGGFVHYRQSTDPALLNMARDQIRVIFPEDFQTFTPTFLFVATWDHVGYYNSRTDKVGQQNLHLLLYEVTLPLKFNASYYFCFSPLRPTPFSVS